MGDFEGYEIMESLGILSEEGKAELAKIAKDFWLSEAGRRAVAESTGLI